MTLRTDLEASMRERIARTIASCSHGDDFDWRDDLDIADAIINEIALAGFAIVRLSHIDHALSENWIEAAK